jgi:RimJ/RimL family protein N-acetyltransferase
MLRPSRRTEMMPRCLAIRIGSAHIHSAKRETSWRACIFSRRGTPGTWFQFAVDLASSGTLIGDVALRTSSTDGRLAELGFTFARDHQGQGYATEAVGAVVQYGFQKLEMHRLCSRTDARNLRARRLLERLGFRREGELRECIWFKGAWATDLMYAHLASDWRPSAS